MLIVTAILLLRKRVKLVQQRNNDKISVISVFLHYAATCVGYLVLSYFYSVELKQKKNKLRFTQLKLDACQINQSIKH